MDCTGHSYQINGDIGMTCGTERDILGCTLIALPRYQDDRGYLVPVWSAEDFPVKYMYYSMTYAGECRDKDLWHIHRHHTDRFVVLQGNLLMALSNGVDMIRLGMSGKQPQMLVIPPGIYHCFRNYWHKDSLMCNLPSEVYDPEDEGRVPFDELGVKKPW